MVEELKTISSIALASTLLEDPKHPTLTKARSPGLNTYPTQQYWVVRKLKKPFSDTILASSMQSQRGSKQESEDGSGVEPNRKKRSTEITDLAIARMQKSYGPPDRETRTAGVPSMSKHKNNKFRGRRYK